MARTDGLEGAKGCFFYVLIKRPHSFLARFLSFSFHRLERHSWFHTAIEIRRIAPIGTLGLNYRFVFSTGTKAFFRYPR